MATPNEVNMLLRVTRIDTHCLVPGISDGHKPGIEFRTKILDEPREGVLEILVLAAPESVTPHHHPAPVKGIVGIQSRDGLALLGRKDARKHRTPFLAQFFCDSLPVEVIYAPCTHLFGARCKVCNSGRCTHVTSTVVASVTRQPIRVTPLLAFKLGCLARRTRA